MLFISKTNNRVLYDGILLEKLEVCGKYLEKGVNIDLLPISIKALGVIFVSLLKIVVKDVNIFFWCNLGIVAAVS